MRGRLLISLLVCAFALGFSACGGDDDGTIPPDDADNLLNQVEAVKDAVDEGNCELAQDHAQELISVVNNLPNEVDSKVASELTKAASNLDELAADPTECVSGASGVTGPQTTDTTETDTTEPETTEPETTTTTTTTEEETTTEETPQEPEPPAGGGNQGDQGGGNTTSPPPTGGAPSPSGGLEPPSGGGK
jgi:hypothetical protein